MVRDRKKLCSRVFVVLLGDSIPNKRDKTYNNLTPSLSNYLNGFYCFDKSSQSRTTLEVFYNVGTLIPNGLVPVETGEKTKPHPQGT